MHATVEATTTQYSSDTFLFSRAPSFTYFWAAASPLQLQHHFGSSIIPLHLSHVVLLFLFQLLVPLAVWDQDGCFVVAHSAMSGRPLSTRSFVLLLLAGCLSLSPIHPSTCDLVERVIKGQPAQSTALVGGGLAAHRAIKWQKVPSSSKQEVLQSTGWI